MTYKSFEPLEIDGNRMTVYFRFWPFPDLWSVVNGRTYRFAECREARVIAEKLGFDDGIHVTTKTPKKKKKGGGK